MSSHLQSSGCIDDGFPPTLSGRDRIGDASGAGYVQHLSHLPPGCDTELRPAKADELKL